MRKRTVDQEECDESETHEDSQDCDIVADSKMSL